MDITIGNIVEGKVTRITPFGAFVELEKGISGLIHISEIANTYVNSIADYLSVDDIVKVKIISIDGNGNKRALSLKQATAAPPPPPAPSRQTASEQSSNDSFEDRLARFIKDSNEKQLALKKHRETKKCK